METEKIIKCKRCGRTYPESLGSCEFCAELDLEYQAEMAEQRAIENGKVEYE